MFSFWNVLCWRSVEISIGSIRIFDPFVSSYLSIKAYMCCDPEGSASNHVVATFSSLDTPFYIPDPIPGILEWKLVKFRPLEGIDRFRSRPVNSDNKVNVDRHLNGIGRPAWTVYKNKNKTCWTKALQSMVGRANWLRKRHPGKRMVAATMTTEEVSKIYNNDIDPYDPVYARGSIRTAGKYWDQMKTTTAPLRQIPENTGEKLKKWEMSHPKDRRLRLRRLPPTWSPSK